MAAFFICLGSPLWSAQQPALGVIKNSELWLKNVESVLDNHKQFADLIIGTSLQVFVQ